MKAKLSDMHPEDILTNLSIAKRKLEDNPLHYNYSTDTYYLIERKYDFEEKVFKYVKGQSFSGLELATNCPLELIPEYGERRILSGFIKQAEDYLTSIRYTSDLKE